MYPQIRAAKCDQRGQTAIFWFSLRRLFHKMDGNYHFREEMRRFRRKQEVAGNEIHRHAGRVSTSSGSFGGAQRA